MTAKEFLSNSGYGSGTNYTTELVASLMEDFGANRLFEGINFARNELGRQIDNLISEESESHNLVHTDFGDCIKVEVIKQIFKKLS